MPHTLTGSSEWYRDTCCSLDAATSACHHLECKTNIRVYSYSWILCSSVILGFILVLHILWNANHGQVSSNSNAIYPQLKFYEEDLHCPKKNVLHFVIFSVTSIFLYDPTQLYLVNWMTRCLGVEKVIFVKCKLEHFNAFRKEQMGSFYLHLDQNSKLNFYMSKPMQFGCCRDGDYGLYIFTHNTSKDTVIHCAQWEKRGFRGTYSI